MLALFHRDVVEVNERAFATLPRTLSLMDQLRHVFSRCLDYYERDLRLSRSMLQELLRADPQQRRAHNDEVGFIWRLSRLAERAQKRGELRSDIEPVRAALLFFDLYVFTLTAWLSGGIVTRREADAALEGNLELCLTGLTPREG